MFEYDDYTEILKAVLGERAAVNSAYSLTAFARDINMKTSQLSCILNQKKGMSEKKALEICQRLGFSADETSYFCDLVNSKHAKSLLKRTIAQKRLEQYSQPSEITILKEDIFRVISDWYHFAILELLLLEGFRSEFSWIAHKLKISPIQVENAIDRLVRLDLVKLENGEIQSTGVQLETTNGIPSESIKKLNNQLIEKARIAVIAQNVDTRYLSTLTTAIHKDDLSSYKALISEFKSKLNKKIMKNNRSKKPDEVYCLTMQFFKLT